MACCCPHAQSANRLFSFFARSYRRRFEKKGFEPSQRQLMAGLDAAGYSNASILEVGSGVGYLHLALLERGAAKATGVELSSRMIEEARQWAQERNLADRVEYYEGDFVVLGDELPAAEVMVMDKVVCCYPDAQAMVRQALARTKRVLALTYPRDCWYVRLGIAAGALLMKLIGSDFRPYLHDPVQIEKWITDAGYSRLYHGTTLVWLSQVFVRHPD